MPLNVINEIIHTSQCETVDDVRVDQETNRHREYFWHKFNHGACCKYTGYRGFVVGFECSNKKYHLRFVIVIAYIKLGIQLYRWWFIFSVSSFTCIFTKLA